MEDSEAPKPYVTSLMCRLPSIYGLAKLTFYRSM